MDLWDKAEDFSFDKLDVNSKEWLLSRGLENINIKILETNQDIINIPDITYDLNEDNIEIETINCILTNNLELFGRIIYYYTKKDLNKKSYIFVFDITNLLIIKF